MISPHKSAGGCRTRGRIRGNLVLVRDLLRDYPAGAAWLLILDRRWDQDWDYDRAGLDKAAALLERL